MRQTNPFAASLTPLTRIPSPKMASFSAGRHGGHLSKTADFAPDDDWRIASPARPVRRDRPQYGEPMTTPSVMRWRFWMRIDTDNKRRSD